MDYSTGLGSWDGIPGWAYMVGGATGLGHSMYLTHSASVACVCNDSSSLVTSLGDNGGFPLKKHSPAMLSFWVPRWVLASGKNPSGDRLQVAGERQKVIGESFLCARLHYR